MKKIYMTALTFSIGIVIADLSIYLLGKEDPAILFASGKAVFSVFLFAWMYAQKEAKAIKESKVNAVEHKSINSEKKDDFNFFPRLEVEKDETHHEKMRKMGLQKTGSMGGIAFYE